MSNPSPLRRRYGPFQRVSLTIIGSLEKFFYNWGYNVALHPWKAIAACLILTATCGLGLINFTQENRPDKLWIPWNSEFVSDTDWLRRNFPSPIRFHYVLIVAENILEPSVLKLIQSIHEDVEQVSADGRTWKDLCFKLPVTKFGSRRKRRSIVTTSTSNKTSSGHFENFDSHFDFDDDDKQKNESTNKKDADISSFDPSIIFPEDVYCEILNNLEEACWESNLVELWNYDAKTISSLTRQKIIDKINSDTISPIFGRSVNYTSEMGGIVRNESGHIVQANSIMIRWFARINQTALQNSDDSTNDLGTGEHVDKNNLQWEEKLVKVLLNKSQSVGPNVSMYFTLARSFGDISQATIWNDAWFLALGFSIVFIYVVFMLGKFNFVEQRPFVSLAGLSCVGLAIVVSYGLCSAFRTIYGPVHNILPFLLLGIGIDDMFVIMQCWNNLTPSERKRSLPERMGLTLKHAGVSITVTSVTDFVAFAIGASTVLPALQSFCLYAALGIVATYIFQATFFVAWFSLDQRRLESNRNAFFFWIKHSDFEPNACSKINLAQMFFEKIYSQWLFKLPVKILVFLFTAVLLGFNIWGNIELRQEFNPIWFLPKDSYSFQYHKARRLHFPGRGIDGFVIINNVSFPENLPALESLVNTLEASEYIFEVDAWYNHFKRYVNTHFSAGVPKSNMSREDFLQYLGKFLFSPTGSPYRARLKYDGNLTCGESSPNVIHGIGFVEPSQLASIGFKFKSFKGPEEHLPAMRELKRILKVSEFNRTESSRIFAWTIAFATWETDEIITHELYRNLAMAMVCVFITTMLLIANIPTCLMVLTCVIFTLVDVGGMMHFWNLTIDTVSCIDLVLAIGLCVDYSAHIGHAFMTVTGSRDERAGKALAKIGPAVLNGGFSTFLAFILLADSKSHVFITFFKIFFLVVIFGLFHGLVFLPVLLSVAGPKPYPSAYEEGYGAEVAVELNPKTNADINEIKTETDAQPLNGENT